jgi:hypothetical protein
MHLKNHQIKILNALMKEKIINSRIEEKILQNGNVKSIRSYYNGLLKRKSRICELAKAARKAAINLDLGRILANVDIIDVKYVLSEFEQKLPLDAKRKKLIIKLAQTEVPQKLILSLVNAKTEHEFTRIVNAIPTAFLIKHGLTKTKDQYMSVKSSLRSISTPMHG